MKSLIVIIITALTTVMFFQNCGGRSYTLKQGLTSLDLNGNGLPDDDENVDTGDVIEDAKINCANAQEKGTLLDHSQLIEFKDTKQETGRSQVCEWGVGDNLQKGASKMQARYEQVQNLNLPANAVICDVAIETQLQKFRYDDVFILTFNDRILAMNNKSGLMTQLSSEQVVPLSGNRDVPLYKYDWLGLRGAEFKNVVDDYCLGQDQGVASCSWPVTEQSGDMYFHFDQELLIHLGFKAEADQQKFGFITTGDDDSSLDCYHEEISFQSQIKYYIAK